MFRKFFFTVPAAGAVLAAGIMTASPALAAPSCSGSGCGDGLNATATVGRVLTLTLDASAVSYNGNPGDVAPQVPVVHATVVDNGANPDQLLMTGPQNLVDSPDSQNLPLAGNLQVWDDQASQWTTVQSSDLTNGFQFAQVTTPTAGTESDFNTQLPIPAGQFPATYTGSYTILVVSG